MCVISTVTKMSFNYYSINTKNFDLSRTRLQDMQQLMHTLRSNM